MPVILKETKNGVAIVTLNREDKMNALNREMTLLLQQVLKECEGDAEIRAVYLTVNGKSFCAGQDLIEATTPGMMERILPEQLNPLVTIIRKLNKPVIAVVKGVAAGAGASLALCCDIVVAASSATFVQAFSRIGLIPDSGATHILPRLVGWQKAAALMMLAENVSGEEAAAMGMIYKHFPDDRLEEESFKIAIALTQMSTVSLALTKQALTLSVQNTFDEQLKVEESLQMKAGNTKEFRERIGAFLQKKRS